MQPASQFWAVPVCILPAAKLRLAALPSCGPLPCQAVTLCPAYGLTPASGPCHLSCWLQLVMLVYIMLTIKLWPFAAGEDNWLQLASLTGALGVLESCCRREALWARSSKGGTFECTWLAMLASWGVCISGENKESCGRCRSLPDQPTPKPHPNPSLCHHRSPVGAAARFLAF